MISYIRPRNFFLYPQSISPHLNCKLCKNIFQDPVRTACGHTFCFYCINKNSQLKRKCPTCKDQKLFLTRSFEKDLLAANLVDELMVRCSHCSCQWQGIYSLFKKHQRICQYKPKKIIREVSEAVDLELAQQKNLQSIQISTDQIETVSLTRPNFEQPMLMQGNEEVYVAKLIRSEFNMRYDY